MSKDDDPRDDDKIVTIKHRTCKRCKLWKYDCMFPRWGKHVGIWCKMCMDKDGLSFATMLPLDRKQLLPTMISTQFKAAAE